MSYRRSGSRHSGWQEVLLRHADLLQKTGIPSPVVQNADTFLRFLHSGEAGDFKLSDLGDNEFVGLERVVNDYLEDGWHQSVCSAFQKERVRRFGRYA